MVTVKIQQHASFFKSSGVARLQLEGPRDHLTLVRKQCSRSYPSARLEKPWGWRDRCPYSEDQEKEARIFGSLPNKVKY